jgi:hypothetical protein
VRKMAKDSSNLDKRVKSLMLATKLNDHDHVQNYEITK